MFMILAIEHRAAMRAIMNCEHPQAAPAAQLREVMVDIEKAKKIGTHHVLAARLS
jgi:hypothetical protein